MNEGEGGDMAWVMYKVHLDLISSALGQTPGKIVCLLIGLAASVSRVFI